MVVVGSRGMCLIGGSMLGSVSRVLLRHAQCPVIDTDADAVKVAESVSTPVIVVRSYKHEGMTT